MSDKSINIKGARVNNLKNLSLSIPRDKLIVVTGVSGSGKSSLLFDTIFAEGQRRYVESLSSFARQFLGRVTKPDADSITGIPPAIVVQQRVNSTSSRSTVGTVTGIYDYLRLLYARIGKTISPVTGREVKRDTPGDILNYIYSLKENTPVYILTPLNIEDPDTRVELLLSLKSEGFSRVYLNNRIENIEKLLTGEISPAGNLSLLVDRVILDSQDEELRDRLFDSVQTAMDVKSASEKERGVVLITGGDGDKTMSFSTRFEADGITFEEPTELLFSFNNPVGACPVCSGLGKTPGIDESLVVPDTHLSVYQEAIACWRGEVMRKFYERLIDNSHKFGFPIHRPYRELTRQEKDLLWRGNEYFTGLNEFFEMLDSRKYSKIQYRYLKARYSGWSTCPECKGKRLRKEALYVRIGGVSIDTLLEMSIARLSEFFKEIRLDDYDRTVAERALYEISLRLSALISTGLPYLTLNRPSGTLSGGESQRINLVSSIGNNLTGSLYILDEPSIGLHPRDTKRLISVLRQLRDLGNSIIVAEHDEEIIREADQIIDIGPDAGIHGGEVVYQGAPSASPWNVKDLRSHTLAYLSGVEKIEIPSVRRVPDGFIDIKGACEHNLKNIDVRFPLRVLSAVTGVSGSGKSTLVRDILYPALNRRINQFGEKPGEFKSLGGELNRISAIEYIDQNPIGKSTRSNPVTYLKVYDEIRKLFSEQPYAKSNGFGHSHFSFNIEGGRCPECMGEGVINIEMQFMADVKMVCESCNGLRFKPEILEVRYHGKNINDVLKMSVEEAIEFFSSQPEAQSKRIAQKLKPLEAVGLSYVQLGQSSSTLSGGESQRVKLASFLGKEQSDKSIMFIFDEPTIGLHFHDIRQLLNSFGSLIERGHTIVVIEHNMDVVKCADWVIDLGPEGGEGGGNVVFEGRPEELLNCRSSYTGAALRECMKAGR